MSAPEGCPPGPHPWLFRPLGLPSQPSTLGFVPRRFLLAEPFPRTTAEDCGLSTPLKRASDDEEIWAREGGPAVAARARIHGTQSARSSPMRAGAGADC